MPITDSTKLKVFQALQDGDSLREIAQRFDMKYPAAIRLKRELDEAVKNHTIATLLDVDQLVLDRVAEAVVEEMVSLEPDPLAGELLQLDSSAAVEEVTKGITGLSGLSVEFQKTATLIVKKTQGQVIAASTATELEILTDVLTKLNDSFFNPKGTNLQIINPGSGVGRFQQTLKD